MTGVNEVNSHESTSWGSSEAGKHPAHYDFKGCPSLKSSRAGKRHTISGRALSNGRYRRHYHCSSHESSTSLVYLF